MTGLRLYSVAGLAGLAVAILPPAGEFFATGAVTVLAPIVANAFAGGMAAGAYLGRATAAG